MVGLYLLCPPCSSADDEADRLAELRPLLERSVNTVVSGGDGPTRAMDRIARDKPDL